jgi:hypothetical protein
MNAERDGRAGRTIAAAIPVVLVNAVAFAGQLAFLRTHLHWPLAGQVLVAVTLESVAIYLAFHAHVAQVADDSSLRLRLASYLFAMVIGAMNYSHYAGMQWRPTFAAVAFALMSASSPWLWAIHSRRVSRDALKAAGLIDPHAVRLGATRWMWHPVWSARVMYHATWEGVNDPGEAIAGWEARRSGDRSASLSPDSPGAALQTGSQTGPRTGRRLPAGPVREALPGQVRPALTRPVWDGESGPVPDGQSGPVRARSANRSAKKSTNRSGGRATNRDAEAEFAAEIAAGQVPSIYQIRSRLHVGNERAKALRQHIARQALSA